MQKTFILVLTHGTWGEELINSTEMVLGRIRDIQAVSFMPDVELEVYIEDITNIMQSHPGYDFIFLVDILGGTPYNIGAYFALSKHTEAVSGLSMDLLISVLDLRAQTPCSEIPDQLLTKCSKNNWYIADLKKFLSCESDHDN